MSLLKKLFGSAPENPEEEKKAQEAKNFDVLKYDGVAALRQNEFAYAIKCFTHALELKDDLETRDYLSQAFIRNNDLPAAHEQLQRLAEAEPANVQIWLRMAEVAYMMEDYQLMAEACEKAKQLDNDNPQMNYDYARACIGQANYINAIALLSKAIAVSKEEPYWDAYLLRGDTLLKMGDVPSAEADADTILETLPDQEESLLLKARCQEARGDHGGAQDTYGKVIDLNPFCLAAFKERGAIRLAAGDKQGAEADARMVIELNPQLADGEYGSDVKDDFARKTEQAYKSVNPFA
jgi:tetratricopeptide (TPR) repeat protein